MSRESSKRNRLSSREKITQKMSHDGLVERNESTGDETRISKRTADIELRGATADRSELSQHSAKSDRQPAREPEGATPDARPKARKTAVQQHNKEVLVTETARQESPLPTQTQPNETVLQQETALFDTPNAPQQAHALPETEYRLSVGENGTNNGYDPELQGQTPGLDSSLHTHKSPNTNSGEHVQASGNSHRSAYCHKKPDVVKHGHDPQLSHEHDTALRNKTGGPIADSSKRGAEDISHSSDNEHTRTASLRDKTQIPAGRRSGKHRGRRNAEIHREKNAAQATVDDGSNVSGRRDIDVKEALTRNTQISGIKTDSGSRLKFADAESAPVKESRKQSRKLTKAGRKVETTGAKLEKARDQLPAKKKLRRERVFDEKKGKAVKKLHFENEIKTQRQHMKGPLPLRPVKAGTKALMLNAHRKIYQVEDENVGTKAAHRVEMIGEGSVRSALRHHKNAPYKKVAKLEKQMAKRTVDLNYQKLLSDNPKLKSNPLSRMWQKRKIKKDYAKAAREAKKAAQKAKKAGSIGSEAAKRAAGVVRRHPGVTAAILLLALLLFMLTSMFSLGSSIGNGGLGVIAASTYPSEDGEILAAEAQYAAMEANLKYELDNYELLHPGYDEYVFDLDDIWHDPYVLISTLSALHDGPWTLDEVQGTLAALFERQYILTETVTTETRYREEMNEDSGELEDVPYDYYICTVTLKNFDLSHLPVYIMSEERLGRYSLFMATLGNRPELFPTDAYPHASTIMDYGRHDIPTEYLSDETFAAIIAEAEKYLGMPYVWGGSNPSTSFDCSGFVSWVLNQTGWSFGRLGAKALYNICTPVSAANAMPGDLIFFWKTYDAPDPNAPTHVGIYVGDGMMLHCGNPIGYVSTQTAYWQGKFFGYGRP